MDYDCREPCPLSGDKVALRYAQLQTISMILSFEDCPSLEAIPEIIIHPESYVQSEEHDQLR